MNDRQEKPECEWPPIRIGSRGSALARWQSEWVAARLREQGRTVEIVWITTQGDTSSEPIVASGAQGLFTKEIQRALLERRVDLAVHSLKDLPTESVDGLRLAAVPPRERGGDALVSSRSQDVEGLPSAAVVGTGSPRRRAQLLHWRPDLVMAELRGNVDTRLRKLDERAYDAIILAEAGLRRLGLGHRITCVLPFSRMLPAVGQGALGLEIRADDETTAASIAFLDDPDTRHAVTAERTLLASLRGGCLAPVGAWAQVESDRLTLRAAVLSLDGQERLEASGSAANAPTDAFELGRSVAEELLRRGASGLIAESRSGHRSP
ncbi:MAG: hydroxymethylbilane synthase [Planctomycetes bacterium]|nr:hydroxymethylbilane synthase [Planctomycetota bacterium]